MQTKIPKETSKKCPECTKDLHLGAHRFQDGIEEIYYCKECGYREEKEL